MRISSENDFKDDKDVQSDKLKCFNFNIETILECRRKELIQQKKSADMN